MFPPAQGLRLDIDAVSQICGSVSIACWIVVFSPQIVENWKRSSAEGLSVVFITVWLLGDFFNIFGAVLQGVLPTMIILAVYYTLADIVLLGQYFWYEGFRLTDKVDSTSASELEEEGSTPTEQSPLLSDARTTRPVHNGSGNGFHTPPRISDIDRRGSAHSHTSFRERFLSVDSRHLSPVTPLHEPHKTPPRPQAPQSTLQTVLFNLGIIVLVCASGIFGWYLSATRSRASTPDDDDSPPTPSPSTLHFNPLGQIFGYICALLYLGSRVPQLLLNYRRKSTDGISMLFFLFACIGNLTYVLSILAYSPVCAARGRCGDGEAAGLYWRYVAVNASWLAGSFGTLCLDAGVFVQYFLYRGDEESDEESDEEDEVTG